MTATISLTVAVAFGFAAFAYLLWQLSVNVHGFIREQVNFNRATDEELEATFANSEKQAGINDDVHKCIAKQHDGLLGQRQTIDTLISANNTHAGHLQEHCTQIQMLQAEVERLHEVTDAAVEAAAAAARFRDVLAKRERVPTEELAAMDKALARFMHEGRLN